MQHVAAGAVLLLLVACGPNAAVPPKFYVFDCGRIFFDDVGNFGLTNAETPVRTLFVPCYLVVHPRGEDWALTTIRKSGGSFENRADLPEAWAGLTDAALEEASGVAGAKFCHNGRFIAVGATREAVMALADLAVAEAG